MREITRLLEPALAEALGWTLLHTLWQGALLALLLALLLLASRKRRPHFRYWCAVGTLLSMLVLAIATFVLLYEPAGPLHLPAVGAAPLAAQAELAGSLAAQPLSWLDSFQPYLPFLVAGWLLGVLLFGLRLIGELAYLQHLRHYRCTALDGEWAGRLIALSRQVGLNRTVQLKETARIHGPMVSGIFKPVILLPIGMVNALSTAEVESILLHELAHVRRLDYLANLLISVVETLFFFHPFVWWMGSKIRTEREHACDDMVVEVTGNAATYVTALAQAESWRVEGRRLAMAFTGSTVLQRVKRILGQESGSRLISARAAGAILVAGCAGLLLLLSTPTQAEQVTPFETEALNGALEPAPAPLPVSEPKTEPALPTLQEPQPPLTQLDSTPTAKAGRDTLPPGTKPEMEMEALERELRQRERQLEQQTLQAEKALRSALLKQERALASMKSEQKAAQLELERAMQELEAQERELELNELELEEQELELERQEETLEKLKAEGDEQTYLESMRALQKQELQLMEAERQLEGQAFALEEQMRKIEIQATRQEQAMESQQMALERQQEQKLLQLEQQQDLLEAEAAAKVKALRQSQRKANRQQDEGPQ